MTEIYIVRHGETDANVKHAIAGIEEMPLNAVGKKQAELLCGKIKNINFDVVYSSPLSRAMDTIAPYLKIHKNIPVHMSYAFIERNFGIWEGLTVAEVKEKYPKQYLLWMNDYVGYKIDGGESTVEVSERVGKALDKILELHKDKKILIVTHRGTARSVIAYLLGLDAYKTQLFDIDNASLSIIQHENSKGTLIKLNG